jgi:RND superfamily putative drug exporter
VVGGNAAELADTLHSLRTHLPIALCIIFGATFIVLLVALSSLAIPIKAIALNTLSLSAAFGLMAWIFQYGHLHKLLQFTPTGSLDPTLPVLIFAIAFGLATDYEVFLVSRIKEEYERTGSNMDAVVTGVEKTGGIITSAGLLLVVVVASFGMSDILSMKEMGVGLAIAVVVDAAIVRTLLVPAAMQMFGNLNWWLPRYRRRSLVARDEG